MKDGLGVRRGEGDAKGGCGGGDEGNGAFRLRAETFAACAWAYGPLVRRLRRYRLGRAGMRRFTQALTRNLGLGSLRRGIFAWYRMKAKAAEALTPALGVLCLAKHLIGVAGSVAVAEVLPRMDAMREADMCLCIRGVMWCRTQCHVVCGMCASYTQVPFRHQSKKAVHSVGLMWP